MNILMELLKIIWFLAPAGFANMAAGVSGKILPQFTLPLDLGYKFRNKRIFGDHKTIRGMLLGTASGCLVYLVQNYLSHNTPILKSIVVANYLDNYILGVALPTGALLGDAVKSFFKRQFDVPPGKSWFPFDQVDWILGTVLASLVVIRPNIIFVLSTIAVGLILHVLIKFAGYILHLQEEKF